MIFKDPILKEYEREVGYKLSADDPVVVLSFIFDKILKRQLKTMQNYFIIISGIVLFLGFICGLMCGFLFN